MSTVSTSTLRETMHSKAPQDVLSVSVTLRKSSLVCKSTHSTAQSPRSTVSLTNVHDMTTHLTSTVTLDSNPATFPINQSLYFDFSHDSKPNPHPFISFPLTTSAANIMGILTAFGFTQFATYLPATEMVTPRDLIVSHMEPFGARLDIEIINTPQPLNASRNATTPYVTGPATTYIHFILNQRTLPLYKSFSACGVRDDGWCELTTFLEVQSSMFAESQYDYACNGNYSVEPYGSITDGAPLTSEVFTTS